MPILKRCPKWRTFGNVRGETPQGTHRGFPPDEAPPAKTRVAFSLQPQPAGYALDVLQQSDQPAMGSERFPTHSIQMTRTALIPISPRPAAFIAFLLLAGCAAGPQVADLAQGQSGWVVYPSSAEKISLRGDLQFPAGGSGKLPAIVIAHASGGLGEQSERWARFFREQGIATFKIDYFGPRGIRADSAVQPVPTNDTIDALHLLASHPRIDAKRIAVIGFSRGAHLAINSASPGYTGSDLRYAAHVGLYPTCGLTHIGKGDGAAPILIMVGSDDDIAPVVQCETLQRDGVAQGRSVTLKVYEGAQHAWDGDYSGVWFHRALNASYRMRADRALTERSQRDVLEFLRGPLKL